MKKFIICLLSVLFVLSCLGLSACTFKRRDDGEATDEGSYVIKYYFENSQGEFVHDSTKDETGTKMVGITISVQTPKTFAGYVFDKDNPKNRLLDVISKESVAHLDIYYKLASSEPEGPGVTPSPEPEPEPNPNPNPPTPVGIEFSLLNTKYVKGVSEVTATINVLDASAKQGVVTLYNTEETINAIGATESYYLFATEGEKASLSIYNGSELIEIKSASISQVSTGNHDYKVVVNADKSVSCSLDGNNVLTVTESEITEKGLTALTMAGRVGSYTDGGENLVNLTVNSGDMSLNEMKEHFTATLLKTPASYYVFNTIKNDELKLSPCFEKKVEDIPYSWIYGFGAETQQMTSVINGCQSVSDFITAANTNKTYRIKALGQHVKASLGNLIVLLNDTILMPMVSASSVVVPEAGVTMYADVYVRDARWWVPNAYMLYSNHPAPNNLGVMDKLELDVNAATDFDVLYNISDKYIDDIVRAVAFKGIEYLYWHEKTKQEDPMVNQWWVLYSYAGGSGAGFEYAGDVFENYTWDKEYRLFNAFFQKAHEGFSNDYKVILDNFIHVLGHQTLMHPENTEPSAAGEYVNTITYNVILNTNGGTIDGASTITGKLYEDLTLPTPTKSGVTFEGWYYNRAYEGTAITSIPQGSNRKDITLYAKWSDSASLAVMPSNVFGSNMVIQQNKPFTVFGTGTNGVTVLVNLGGVEKTTTVSDGKWSVTFDAMTATFDERTMTISGGGVSYYFDGLVVGEVWLGAGQSNMQMTLSWINGTGVNYVGQYGYHENFDKIRMFRQKITGLPFNEDKNNSDRWVICRNPNEASAQSAYMISFALNLQKKLGVPVGVIVSAQGNTYIEEWLSSSSIASTGSVIDGISSEAGAYDYDGDGVADEFRENSHFYEMYEQLRGLKISGVIWYQGENNAWANNHPEHCPNSVNVSYKNQLTALHNQYKDIFGDENIPLIVTELAPYAWDDYKDFRLIQRDFVSNTQNTYLLSTVDIGEAADIHPVYKNELGRRAANIALEFAYQAEGVSDTLSYLPVSATSNGSTITLSFESGKTIVQNGALIGFKVEDMSGNLIDVSASISGNTVVLNYAGQAKNVFYMYEKAATDPEWMYYYVGVPGLFGGNGLPVAPFKIAVS